MELNSKTNAPAELPNHDFQKTVAESKAAVQAEGEKKVRKSRSDKGRSKRQDGTAGTPAPQPGTPTSPGQAPTGPTDLSPYIAVPLQALSGIPAKRHGIAELALSPEEAKACAEAINGIFNAFVPNINQMSPKTAAIMGAVMVFGSIGFTKYQIFSEVQAERNKKLAPETPGNDKAETGPADLTLAPGSISAFDHMRR